MEFDLEHPLSSASADNILNSKHNLALLNLDTCLFHLESQHMPSNAPQFDDTVICFCKQTISSIYTYSSSHNFDPFLTYLSINYLHRFLAIHPIQGKSWISRLVAVSCVSLAMKMTRNTEFSAIHIQSDCGFVFDKQTIRRMELLILGALKWRMRSITPFSFINFFISFFKFKDQPSFTQSLKARAAQIIFNSQHEVKMLEFKPSIVAASALLSASHELFPLQHSDFSKAISTCSYVNKVSLEKCKNVMQDIVTDGYKSVFEMAAISSSNTPVNVLDRQQWSSSGSDIEKSDTGESAEICRAFKRRKVHS